MTDSFTTTPPSYPVEVASGSWKVFMQSSQLGNKPCFERAPGWCIFVSASFLGELNKVILKFDRKNKQARRANTFLKHKHNEKGYALPSIKTYLKSLGNTW